jgi:serine/threonine protein kinase
MSDTVSKTLYGRIYVHPKDDKMIVKSSDLSLELPGVYDDPRRELKVLQELTHFNIIQLFGFQESSDRLRLFLERAHGGDLLSYMEAWNHTLSEVAIRHIMLQVVEALKYLHVDKKISHMDVSLENILVMDDQKTMLPWITLTDFGSATAFEEAKYFVPGKLPGKAKYMAPELWQQVSVNTHAVDIFAFGVCLYSLTYGKFPYHFSYDQGYALFCKVGCRAYSKMCGRIVSDALIQVIEACMDPNPEDRPTAAKLLQMSFFKPPVLPVANG